MSDDIRVGLVRVSDILFHPHNTRVDLGDLRTLAQSIDQYGMMQPVVVERHGDTLRLRAGHRRLAAAKIAHLPRVPAIIHSESLPEKEWLEHAVQENVQRRELDAADRRRTIEALRRLHCTWGGIADTFGVSEATVRSWATGRAPEAGQVPHVRPKKGPSARARATQRLIERHRDEFESLLRIENAVGREAAA